MSKVIIAGAGIGGLTAAYFLGKAGHSVIVFEEKERANLSYPWHDDMSPAVFEQIGLPKLSSEHYFTKVNWGLVPPFSDTPYLAPQIPGKEDISVDRIALSEHLIGLAEEYAEIRFSSPVDSLIIENGGVEGLAVGGSEYRADLVIDSAGAFSPLRSSLPEEFGIERQAGKGGIFYAWRAFFTRSEGTFNYSHKAYLKHLGETGISWVRHEQEGETDVLIGRVDALKKEEMDTALKHLREKNPSIGDTLIKGGNIIRIPVRRPLLKMTAKGYAAIGDAAFMTIPMLGSGIASSMLAAKLLADAVAVKGFTPEGLWKYERDFWLAAGARHLSVDIMKRWLMEAPSDDLRFLFESGIMDEETLANASSGKMIKLNTKELIAKLMAGRKRPFVLLNLNGALTKMKKAYALALQAPEAYEQSGDWREKLNYLVNKTLG